MRLNNLSLEGLVGALVFLAGAHLLWKSRDFAIAWLKEFFRILRGEFARKSSDSSVALAAESPTPSLPRPRPRALILVGALALILLGQFLFLLDLTF